jgi:glyoxylase-like metal-dependent hydrolase (beta-lactamase superfamily II)
MSEFQLVTDNIARLEMTAKIADLFSTSVTSWLVRGDQGFILIDTGPPQTAGVMVDAVAEATGGKGPSLILLTHGHYNHAGGLTALQLAWNPPIAAHVEEVPFIVGDRDYPRIRSNNPGYWLGSLLMESNPWSIPNVSKVTQGQKLMGLNVMHLPGHTPGHLGFLHEKDRAFICGDAILNLGQRLMAPSFLTTTHPKLARHSIFRMTERNFMHLLPSHGQPILKEGRQRLFEYAQKKARRRKSSS